MAGSTISLDSLSSPSPSPSPPPESSKPAAEPTSAGLDDDSELSELTEEEQEAEKRNEHENTPSDRRNHASRRGLRPSRRGGRRKRSSIVPAPMWGWAETKSSNVVEEEEEEEMAGPPRAMEEEEDDEEPAEEEDGESVVTTHPPRTGGSKKAAQAPALGDRLEEEGRGQGMLVDRADEEEDMSGDEGPPPRVVRRVRRSTRVSRPREDAESGSSNDEARPSEKNGRTRQDEDVDDDASDADAAPARLDAGSENETESEDEESKGQNPVVPSGVLISPALVSTASFANPDVDVTAPPPQDVAPLAAAAAASSIMAGSTVIARPSPTPSSSSSASGSPASSRSPSPAPSAKVPAERAAEAEDSSIRPRRESKAKLVPAEKNAEIPTPKDKEPPALDMDVDPPENDPEQDPDRSVEDVEADEPTPDDDLEVELESDLQPAHRAEALDVLATIELKFALLRERVYVEKMEGLAWEEALVGEGMLSMISMLLHLSTPFLDHTGSHPELLHLQRELLKRRDKRIELATRKRSYEIANVTKRRRMDEDATWSWWKVSPLTCDIVHRNDVYNLQLARDELQTDMISETNRKRRRLERERRAMERPQPGRYRVLTTATHLILLF